jgi:cell division protein FtsW (lipid II flippase)
VTTATFAPARPNRRGTELFLLLFAIIVATGALSAVVLAHDNRLTAKVGYLAGGFLGVYLLAHFAVRKLAPAADPLLLPIMALLNGLGLAEIYRLDLGYADRARQLGKPIPAGRAELQLAYSFVAVLMLIAVLWIIRDHRTLARYTYTSAFVGLGLLATLVFAPSQNGARIALPVLNIQPGEFSKILLMIFFAGYLVRKREVLSVVTRSFLGLPLPRARDMGPLLLAWIASLLILVVIKDLGTSLLFFGIFLALLYVATERASWVVIGLLLFAASAVLSYYAFGHVRLRVDIWLHPFKPSEISGNAYQLVQGLFGLANGGLLGTGLGRGRPDVVPSAWNDFILSSLGEEIGAVGVMAILVLYFLLVARGLRAALGVRDGFGKLLAAGIGTAFAIQVFVVAGGVLRVIPLTGLTLPFVAYGGSSLLANAILIALLLRISDAGRRPPPAPSEAVPLYDPQAVDDSPTQVVRL